MAVIRPKDLPRVTSKTAGDIVVLDGATSRSIDVDNLLVGTGTGSIVHQVSPSLTTPTIGVAAATSVTVGADGVMDTSGAGPRFVDIGSFGVNYGSIGGTISFYTGNVLRGKVSASASDWTFGAAGATQGTLTLTGATSGGTKLTALAAASGIVTIPSATDTLVGKATTDTLTNKTFDTAGTGNSLKINGVAITANTGTGSNVLASSPTLVTPNLGTPSALTLTSATGLPVATGISGFGTGVATFLATPSSANLAATLTDETGSGAVVFATSPTLVTPALGTPSALVLTNATGLPLSGHTTQAAYTVVGNNTNGAAAPTAVDIALLTTKASPAAGDYIWISDQAASGAWKKATVSSIASAGSVSSIAGNTGAFTLGTGLTNSGNTLLNSGVVTVKKQVFANSGTYTPSTGMLYCVIECVGGGGAGGGVTAALATYTNAAGGGAGGYSRLLATAATIGASKAVTIGAGGTGSAGATGGAGGDTSVGVLCIGKGGAGGGLSNSTSPSAGGAGGVAGTGDLTSAGAPGSGGYLANNINALLGLGWGGSSIFGGGGNAVIVTSGLITAGTAAGNYGSGGGGASAANVNGTTAAGGAGSAGVVFITEYCSQ